MRSVIILFSLVLVLTGCKKESLHWQKIVPLESHTSSRLNRIQFIDDNTGIIGGGEKYEKAEVLISKDGGNTWTFNSFPEAGKGMYGLTVSKSGSIYLSGYDGRLIVSDDNANNWKVSQITDWRYYIAIAYPTNDTGIYVATASQNTSTVVRVNSDLKIMDTTTYNFGLNDIAFPTSDIGYVAGFGTVLKTTNRGNTWKILDVKNDNFSSVYCIDENNVWVCGYNGSLFHTTDGGDNWEKIRNGNSITQSRYRLKDILFKDDKHGWAVGEEGLVIQTNDGGNTWQEYKSFTDATLLSIAIMPDGNLLVAGEKGALYKLYI